jgi:amino acid transporter
MFAVAAFIGFEATTIFRDEARNPDRTIPRATYAAVIGIGVFYTLAAWAIVMAWGPDNVVAVAAEDPGTMIIATMSRYLGVIGEVGVNFLLITAMFACVLSFHNVITRYQHTMANAGVLPDRLGRVHPTHLSPHTSSLVQTITAMILVAVFALFQLDPVLQVFTWFSGIATLAVVLLMAVTSIAVLVYFARSRADRRIWNTAIAPIVGLAGLLGAAYVLITNFPMLVGDTDASDAPVFGWLSAMLLGLIALFAAFGYVQAVWIRKRRPAAYVKLSESIAA